MSANFPQTYNLARAVTPSDTVNFAQQVGLPDASALYIGGAGVVAAVLPDDSVVNFTCVAAQLLPVHMKRVNSTNTTATLLVALYCV
jgi:hypothetical protein